MSKRNDDFFVKKKPWSMVKDELLACYLKPYFQKMLKTYHPIAYVDCFAGAGKFLDGTNGSPLIALEIIQNALAQAKVPNGRIESYFIEANHVDILKKNLNGYPNIQVIGGKFEDNIQQILREQIQRNIFLYIDPYGVKELDFSFLGNKNFRSMELLMNFNSVGFLRVAFSALDVKFQNEADLPDEYDSSLPKTKQALTETATKVAGGEYWKDIVADYHDGRIDFQEAEKLFVAKYCRKLNEIYRYVLNMPIRIKKGQSPKYRMIHATNHPDGAILMADNIYKREELMREIQSGGQLSLFENSMSIDLEKLLSEYLQSFTILTPLNVLLARFFCTYGVICSLKEVRVVLKKFESHNKIIVERNPPITSTGKLSTFWDTKKVSLKWNT